jgi:hypothetical protein
MPSWEHIKQTERPDLQKTYSAPKRTCFESLYTEPTMGRFLFFYNFIRCQQAHDAEDRLDNCKYQCHRGE